MSTGLRAWVASHSETRWAIAIAMLCAVLVGAAFFWPDSPSTDSRPQADETVRMSVSSAAPEMETPAQTTHPDKSPPKTTTSAPGAASAPLPATQPVQPDTKAEAPRTESAPPKQASKPVSETEKPAPTAGNAAGQPRGYFVQVGSFRQKKHAETLKQRLINHHWPVRIQLKRGELYAVWVGGYASRDEANKVRARLASQEKLPGFITSR